MNAKMTTWETVRDKARILNALAIRDVMSRYGHGNIGFFWLVAEPLILTGGVMFVWGLINGSSKHGVHIVPFVLTGYSMLTLWRHLVYSSISCFGRSADVLYHRAVTPFDILLSKQFTEIFGVLTAFFVAYVPLRLLDLTEPIDDYLTFFGAWFLMSFFTFGVGLIIASLTEMTEAAERFIGPIMYLLLPASGSFYMVGWMPRGIQDSLTYIPMLNAMEMFRGGYFGPSIPTYWDAGYIFICGLVVNAAGFAMISKAIRRLEFR